MRNVMQSGTVLPKILELMRKNAVWCAFLALFAVCMVSSEDFRNAQNLLNITRQISYSGIIALGMTLIIIGGGIDLSVGSLLALSGGLGIMVMNQFGNPAAGLAAGALSALLLGGIGGGVNGALVTVGGIPPFIATLGTMSIYRSLTLFFANAGLISSSNELFGRMGELEILGISLPALIFLAFTAGGSILLKRTKFGRHLCAVGSNIRVARYAAIHTGRVQFYSYVLCGLLAGLSAFMLGGRLCSLSSTTAGLAYELDGIAAAIIGGTSMNGGRGSLWGTLAGALILGLVSNILDMWGISVNLQGTVKGLVIIIAVLLQRKWN